MANDTNVTIPWKRYTYAVTEASLIFLLASFCLGVYFMSGGIHSMIWTCVIVLLYCFTVGASLTRMFREFTIAAVMLTIPIAPLIILIIAVSLIHLLQLFKL